MRPALPSRLTRRGSAVATAAALCATLLAPASGVAHADQAEPELTASSAATVGDQAYRPPIILSAVVAPDGDLVVAGTVYDQVTLGGTILYSYSDAGSGFVARLTPDGSDARWAHATGVSGLEPHDLRLEGSRVIYSLRATGSPTGYEGLGAVAYSTGGALWDAQLGNVRFCSGPDVAADPDGNAVLVGSYTGSLYLNDRYVDASDCTGMVVRIDTATGRPVDGAVLGAGVRLQHVAVAQSGALYLAGAHVGNVDIGSHTLTADRSEAKVFVVQAILSAGVVDVPWAEDFGVTCSCAAAVNELLLDGERLVLRTSADVLPGAAEDRSDHVATISAGDGMPVWQRDFPSYSWNAPSPLALGADGTVLGVVNLSGATDLGGGHVFDGDGIRTVVFALDGGSGSTVAARRLGELGRWLQPRALVRHEDEMVVSGYFDVRGPDGVLREGVNVARVPALTGLGLSLVGTMTARSAAGIAIDSPSDSPVALSVSGPCELSWSGGPGGWLTARHTGSCTVTATQQDPTGTASTAATVSVLTAVPQVVWPLTPVTYGAVIGATQLNARFVDGLGDDVPGDISYSVNPGVVPSAGQTFIRATFRSATGDVADRTVVKALWVRRALPSVRWEVPAVVTYGWRVPTATARGVDGNPLQVGVEYNEPPGTLLDVSGWRLTAVVRAASDNYDANYTETFVRVVQAASGITTRYSATRAAMVAIVRDTSNNLPLADARVRFQAGAESCVVLTDASGLASCPVSQVDAVAVLTGGFTASFEGDWNHQGSSHHQDRPI